MKLYLVQHGEAVSKEEDPERPLSAKGKKDVMKLAACLKAAGQRVDLVLHSGKLRAMQTADILAEAILVEGAIEVREGLKPNDTVQDLLLDEHNKDTMLVGHLPFMARMVSYLVTGKDEPAIVNYQPGSIVCLEKDEEEEIWQIQWMLRPDTV